MEDSDAARLLQKGLVIPAHPLALTSRRTLDERRQRALTRYYSDAGAGGIAVAVHTTQFAVRDPRVGLLEPVLSLAAEEMDRADQKRHVPLIRIGGVCGLTTAAVAEATLLRRLKYHAALVSMAALRGQDDDAMIAHCASVGQTIPLIGFYLQPAVGGRTLSYRFWRRFLELSSVVAIKIAPFNRYQTLDVVRAVVESGRGEVALYTGNDDNIVADLLTTYRFNAFGKNAERRMVGGLLGHWSVGTRRATELLNACHESTARDEIPASLLCRGVEVTDCNAAYFDAANNYAGCIAGLHEVLRRQGLLDGIWCLDEDEGLSLGQAEEISRVMRSYPHLQDTDFVEENRGRWLSG